METAKEDAAAGQPAENRFGVRRSAEAIMKNSVIYGSPATVIERIREYEATGIQQMMGMFIWDGSSSNTRHDRSACSSTRCCRTSTPDSAEVNHKAVASSIARYFV